MGCHSAGLPPPPQGMDPILLPCTHGQGNSVRGRAHPHRCSPRPVVPGPPPSPPSAQAAMLQHPPSAPHLSSLSHLADSPQELLLEGCLLRSRGWFWSWHMPLGGCSVGEWGNKAVVSGPVLAPRLWQMVGWSPTSALTSPINFRPSDPRPYQLQTPRADPIPQVLFFFSSSSQTLRWTSVLCLGLLDVWAQGLNRNPGWRLGSPPHPARTGLLSLGLMYRVVPSLLLPLPLSCW